MTVLGDDILPVPLHGHTRGHCGVAVRESDEGWERLRSLQAEHGSTVTVFSAHDAAEFDALASGANPV